MSELKRRKPDPVPAIHPVPEYLAEGGLAALYDDTKQVLQVPWVGVIAMAYAHYPRFYDTLWRGLRRLFASRALVEACAALRRAVEDRVAELAPPPITGRLESLGYAPREIAQIRALVEVFSHGNFPYCVMATLARLALEGGALPARRDAEPYRGRLPGVSVPLVLIEAHHADGPTRALYDEIKETLGLPFVNTDYRALARWPSYFALAWDDLKRAVATPAYEAIVADTHARLVETVRALPNPGGLAADELRAAAEPQGEVLAMCRLFHWLLPGLVTNVAYLRAQLAGA